MNEVILPPSPNWYLSSNLSCAADGTVAWGARNSIVIGKPQSDGTILYSLISNAHSNKVTSLAFCPSYGEENKNLIISGGDHHIVRIWSTDTLAVVSAQSFMDTKQTVVGVDWSKCDPEFVCFVSQDGQLMSWTITYNAGKLFTFGKLTATCLACSPHKSNIVAIGAKNGLIYVVNLQGKGTINYKLRGHDVEITSLSWCPTEDNVLHESGKKDMLLASGAKDRSIFIWRAGGDGRNQTCIPLPVSPMDTQQHKVKLPTNVGNFTVVCWAEPKLLIACSTWGEVICWDLAMGSMNKPTARFLHGEHTRGVFCIANVPKVSLQEENWRQTTPTIIWTLAQDRQVIKSSVTPSGCKIEYSVPTQGGYVYCMAACPFDTSRIAFGAGDAMLRLWNLSEPHKTSFDVTTQWQKIMGQVRSIDWHPEKENLLAFGTGDGRVGVWDTNSTSKPPTLCLQYHRETVYSLGWGPNPDDKSFVLYSCGDNELVYYPFYTRKLEPKSVVKKGCTEFSWKLDYSCLAVGYEDGSISFMDRNLKDTGTPIYGLKKAVQCLAWHFESTSTDLSLSPFRNYLAVATNSNVITILDLTALIETMESSKDQTETQASADSGKILHKVFASLSGHSEKVVSLAWSPHFSGHLAAGGYDNTVQVWKIETQELMATYVGHAGPVQCCMWSPLDPDYMITGSSDFTLRIWRISDQKAIPPSEKVPSKRVRTKKKKSSKNETKVDTMSQQDAKISEKVDEISEAEEIADRPSIEFSKEANNPKSKKERIKKSSYLPVYSAKILKDKSAYVASLRDLAKRVHVAETEETNGTVENSDEKVATIFGDRDEVSIILDEEYSSHVKQGHYNVATEMSLWNNNLRKNLQEATKEKRLNDFLVSLSAGLSMKTWQETCEAYATQLLFESNPTKAVSYLLSIHKIDRAIQVFIDQKMLKEAYVLARCRVDEEDPIFTRILDEWISHASKEGNFEDVAQCCVKLGDFARAARFLGRRKDPRILELAAEFGKLSEEAGLCESLSEQVFHESLLASDTSGASRLTKKFPEIRHRRAQIEAFEEIGEMLKREIDASTISGWLSTGTNHNLLEKLRTRCENYTEDYDVIASTPNFPVPENGAMLQVTTSHHLAMHATTDVEEKQVGHLLNALEAVSAYEVVYMKKNSGKNEESILIRYLANLESKRPRDETSLFQKTNSTLYKSLRAFLCLGLLNWLTETEAKEIEISDDLLGFVEKLLTDALDKQTVKYWTISNEVNKLESALRTAMGKSERNEDNTETREDTTELLKKLDNVRNEKKVFLEERVSAPSPILAYSKANQLADILPDGNAKDSFVKTLSEVWQSAIS